MILYLKKIGLYIISALFLLYISDYVVTNGLKQTEYVKFAKLNDIFDGKIDADVLIMGGSDAGQHFSPSILDSILHTNTYNLGLAGHNFYLQHALFENYIKHKGNKYPKVIIQAVNINLLQRRKDFYAYKSFLPYLNTSNINQYTSKYEGLDWEDYIVPFIRYSGDLELIKIGVFEFFGLKKYTNNLDRGYVSYDRPWEGKSLADYKQIYPRTVEPEVDLVQLFDEYLAAAKANGTKVYLIQSPFYVEAKEVNVNWDEISALYKGLADKYDFSYYDYSSDPLCLDKENFYDYGHLNKSNSFKFSKIIADRLNQN